jgi:hypothetical protein
MSDIAISLPPLAELARHWHEAEAILRRATARSGCYEPADILALAFAGRMGIWFVRLDGELVAIAVSEIRQYPRKRVLEVPFIAGVGMSAWHRPLLAALEAHGRAAGCVCIAGYDRRGWGRVAGFAERGAVLVRDL